jgi:hypothetical protein
VFTGTSESLLLHPSEFIESRKEAEAMSSVQTPLGCKQGHEVSTRSHTKAKACLVSASSELGQAKPVFRTCEVKMEKICWEPQQATQDI